MMQYFSRVSFLEVFWPNIERQIWGFSSSSCSWRRARVYAQHSRHCDPRSTVQLRLRTSVLRLILTHAHQLTSCPHYPKPGPNPLHVLGGLIRGIVGLTLAVNLGGRARALSHLRVPIAASLYSLRSTLGGGPGLYTTEFVSLYLSIMASVNLGGRARALYDVHTVAYTMSLNSTSTLGLGHYTTTLIRALQNGQLRQPWGAGPGSIRRISLPGTWRG